MLKILIEERLGYPVELISDGLDIDLAARSRLKLGGVPGVWSALAAADVDIYPEVRACVVGETCARRERELFVQRVSMWQVDLCATYNTEHTACALVGIARRSVRCCGSFGLKVWLSEELALYNMYIPNGSVRLFICDPFLVRKCNAGQ